MKTRLLFFLILAGFYVWGVQALGQTANQSLSAVKDLYTHPEVLSAQFEQTNR